MRRFVAIVNLFLHQSLSCSILATALNGDPATPNQARIPSVGDGNCASDVRIYRQSQMNAMLSHIFDPPWLTKALCPYSAIFVSNRS
jgi:hypothetical protein